MSQPPPLSDASSTWATERVSDWIGVSQSMIDAFGSATLDPDPLHVDPAWAARNSPFQSTIAFGFLTVSLLTHLMHSATETGVHARPDRDGIYLNYGFDRLRLVEPVPVGSRVRGRFRLLDRSLDAKGRYIARFDSIIDIEGRERPALTAAWLSVWLPPAQA